MTRVLNKILKGTFCGFDLGFASYSISPNSGAFFVENSIKWVFLVLRMTSSYVYFNFIAVFSAAFALHSFHIFHCI